MSESFEISLTLARPNVIFFALQQSHRRHCEEAAGRRGNDWIKSVICAAHHLVCHEQ